jgi:hypothetical protein
MGDSDPAIPCGLVAKSFFNDTFELYKFDSEPADKEDMTKIKLDDNTKIPIKETNIAWASDIEYKFKNIQKKYFSDAKFDAISGKTYEDV